ncbi:MAG: type II toxin-antitoxin system RelE/ParE family toxin [Microthrixaceae bacterium]
MQIRITESAQSDINEILRWTANNFGDEAAQRYLALVTAAIFDVAEDPERVGSISRPELGPAAMTWHLRLSRSRSSSEVQRPRHFLIYRVVDQHVLLGRVLHDAMEPSRHMGSDETFE